MRNSCAPASRPTSTVVPASIAPRPGVSAVATTRPPLTVTSWVSVLHGAARSVSVPQVARTRETEPQSAVNAPTELTGSAYWLSPPSPKFPMAVRTEPVSVRSSSRARRSTPMPRTSSVEVPGGSAGPNR